MQNYSILIWSGTPPTHTHTHLHPHPQHDLCIKEHTSIYQEIVVLVILRKINEQKLGYSKHVKLYNCFKD